MKKSLFAAVMIFIGSNVDAEVYIIGHGNITCGQAAVYYSNNDNWMRIVSWVSGFASGANVAIYSEGMGQRMISPLVEQDSLSRRLIEFCREHPDKPIVAAAEEIYLSMPRVTNR